MKYSLLVKPTVQNLKIALQFCRNSLQHTCRPAKCEPFFKFLTRLSFCCSGFLINRDSHICRHLLTNSIECLQRRNKQLVAWLTHQISCWAPWGTWWFLLDLEADFACLGQSVLEASRNVQRHLLHAHNTSDNMRVSFGKEWNEWNKRRINSQIPQIQTENTSLSTEKPFWIELHQALNYRRNAIQLFRWINRGQKRRFTS